MKAMIYAAGLGTRLKPLTDTKPKALVEIHNTPLLEIAIRKLIKFGFDEIIINIHHHAEQIKDFIKKNNSFGIRIEFSDESGLLLDTGGGLKKAFWFFDDFKPFLVYNVDILTDLDLKRIYNFHISKDTLVTLAVRKRTTSRYLLFDDNAQLCGWENTKLNIKKIIAIKATELNPFAFSGIHVINPSLFMLMTEEGYFSIIDVYLRLARKQRILAYNHDNTFWMDLGRKENLEEAEKLTDERLFC